MHTVFLELFVLLLELQVWPALRKISCIDLNIKAAEVYLDTY